MGVNWANLPGDLLIEIAKRCKSVEDMAMFSCVCTSWNAVSSIAKAKLAPAVPWIMLPDNIENTSSCKWAVHNPSRNKSYKMELPETRGRCCWGCADGWIFTLDLDMDTELFNPLTKDRISLPPAHTFPMLEGVLDFDDLDHRDWFRMSCIKSVSIIQTPPDNELRVFVMYDKYFMAFARSGDLAWSALECYDEIYPGTGMLCSVENVVCFNGDIFILYENGKLSSLCKLDSFGADQSAGPFVIHKDEVDFIADVYVPGEIGGAVSLYATEGQGNYTPAKRLYLLEGFGDLLVLVEYMKVCWIDSHPSEELMTWRFEVYKLDSRGKKWAKSNDLGDVALFVSDRSTMAVRASSADNCKPNCVYFIEDKVCPVNFKEYALGVFDLTTGVMEEIFLEDANLYEVCSPFWLMPKLV